MKFTKANRSFRNHLSVAIVSLIMLIFIPVLLVELKRPWQKLDQLIEQANLHISAVSSNIEPDELNQMNSFAFEIAKRTKGLNRDYLIWTFNLYLENQTLPAEQELLKALKDNGNKIEKLNYPEIQQAFAFWQQQFFANQGVLELMRRHKTQFIKSNASAQKAGFILKDTYLMADDGTSMIFILDGLKWYESTYPGLVYDVIENDCPYFRSYLQSGPGFYYNPKYYYLKIFPKFDTDSWGSWYTVWQAEKDNQIFSIIAVDLNAKVVKTLMQKLAATIILTSILIFMVILITTNQLSKMIAQPIEKLVLATEKISRGNYDISLPAMGSKEIVILFESFNKMVKGLKERLNMQNTLEKLLSKELASQVAEHGLVLGGKKVDVTILFTDFAGFTPIARSMDPEEVVNMLNEYFLQLILIIKKWGGLPDKFIGDAIVAMFGAPVSLENHAEYAVCAALEMQLKMRQLNIERQNQGKPILEMRVGLNSGEVIAGAIGSELKLEYTTIGETTNLAQRMESMCAIGHVLITEITYNLVKHVFFEGIDIDPLPQALQVKGYDHPVSAYNLYISNTKIVKIDGKAGTDEFYQYDVENHHLKTSSHLTPEEKAKYKKFIQIKLDE